MHEAIAEWLSTQIQIQELNRKIAYTMPGIIITIPRVKFHRENRKGVVITENHAWRVVHLPWKFKLEIHAKP